MARIIRADRRGGPVVPAVLADAATRARALLEESERQAQAIHVRATEAGRAQGRAELAAELLELAHAREQALRALEPQTIEIALQAAKRVIASELQSRPELIRAAVEPLLARLRRARRVTVRVHPEDRAALDELLEAPRAKPHAQEVVVEVDAAITRGGCVLHSDIGTLDARIETQLQALARALGDS